MKRATAESIVDAYGWAVELGASDMDEGLKVKVDGLCDSLRDFLVLQLSDEAVPPLYVSNDGFGKVVGA